MLILGFVIAQIIIFTVIVIILKRLIFKDTTSAINRLNKIDAMNREKERMLAEKLDQTEKFLETRKKELEEEEKRLKQEAQRAANQLYEDIVKKGKTEAEDIVKKAQESRNRMKAEAVVEAESRVLDFCRDIMNKILSNLVQVEVNEHLIQEFMKELEHADLSRVAKDVTKVDITSGRPVHEATKKVIKGILENKLGRPVEVVFEEDAALLGGLIIRFGTLVVDGSLAERLKETADKLKEELNWRH